MAHAHTLLNAFRLSWLVLVLTLAVLWSRPLHAQSLHPTELDLYSVHYNEATELTYLGRILDVWEVEHDMATVLAPVDDTLLAQLHADGYTAEFAYSVLQGIGAEQTTIQASASFTSTIPYFPCYRTTAQLEADMHALASAHPQLSYITDFGNSWEKEVSEGVSGHPLYALVLSNQLNRIPKYRFLIVAAMHARELTPAEIAMRYAEHLVSQYGFDADITWLLDYGEVHIVPLANPDGREYADQLFYWRKNTNSSDGCSYAGTSGYGYGVDLNRNADMKWGACESGECSSPNACDPTYRGSTAASEPETVALQQYSDTLFADQREEGLTATAPITTTGAVVSLHSYAQKILYPWGWSSSAAPNKSGLQALGNRLAAPLDYISCQTGDPGCLYETDGDYVDWVYDRLGVPAYTIEYGTAFFQSCNIFEDDILQQAMESLTLGFKYARQPYALTTLEEVETVELSRSRVMIGETVMLTATLAFDDHHSSASGATADEVAASAIRVTVDEPSWADTEPSMVITSTTNVTDSHVVTMAVDSSDLSPGQHMLFVEAIDAMGSPGIPTAVYLETLDVGHAHMPFVSVDDRFIGKPDTR